MSIENTFYLVDWKTLKNKYAEEGCLEYIGESLDNDESWLEYYEFNSMDSYYENWRAIFDFSDWYLNTRKIFPEGSDENLYKFLQNVGCVTDEQQALIPVQELTPEEDEWIFCAISEKTVVDLLNINYAPEMNGLKKLIESSINKNPLGNISNYEIFSEYINGYRKLLSDASETNRGVLVLAG